ncbi:hypothetical protein BST61_g10223 [Cercospora zeina]
MESFTAAIKQQWQDSHLEQVTGNAKHAPPDTTANVRGCSPTHMQSMSKDIGAPLKGAPSPSESRLPYDFDPVLFATSDRSQRQFLARKSLSLPVELFFYHVGRVLGQEQCPAREQIGLIWSKLTHEETDRWQTLLDQLHQGDKAAADSAGTELLTEHEVFQKLDVTNLKSQDLPDRRLEDLAPSNTKQEVQDHKTPNTRPATRATARLSRHGATKSPCF